MGYNSYANLMFRGLGLVFILSVSFWVSHLLNEAACTHLEHFSRILQE